TLLPAPTKLNREPVAIDIQINEQTNIRIGKEAGKQLAVGQAVSVWLAKGSKDVAAELQVGKPPEKTEKKPAPEKGKNPVPEDPEKKPEATKKPKEPAKPARDPAPT